MRQEIESDIRFLYLNGVASINELSERHNVSVNSISKYITEVYKLMQKEKEAEKESIEEQIKGYDITDFLQAFNTPVNQASLDAYTNRANLLLMN